MVGGVSLVGPLRGARGVMASLGVGGSSTGNVGQLGPSSQPPSVCVVSSQAGLVSGWKLSQVTSERLSFPCRLPELLGLALPLVVKIGSITCGRGGGKIVKAFHNIKDCQFINLEVQRSPEYFTCMWLLNYDLKCFSKLNNCVARLLQYAVTELPNGGEIL